MRLIMRLLLIEDNSRLAGLLIAGLERRGFHCDHAETLIIATEAVAAEVHDVLIVDRGLPDGDGITWLRGMRRAGFMQPALILTARDALEDRITGLDAGADDYVVKPAEVDEIAARIRALMRRPGPRAQTELRFGPLLVDSARRMTLCAGQAIDLSRRETDLLELLLRQAGAVVRRESIESALYSFAEPVTPNAVEATVSRLRRKLEEAGARGMLHTVRGVGYMLREPAA
jgi:two-component system response regulator QseB